MPTASTIQIVPLGELVAAVFDQAKRLTPAIAGQAATRVVIDMLLRTANTRALRALQARRQVRRCRDRRGRIAS
jgi:hypothetical protein